MDGQKPKKSYCELCKLNQSVNPFIKLPIAVLKTKVQRHLILFSESSGSKCVFTAYSPKTVPKAQ